MKSLASITVFLHFLSHSSAQMPSLNSTAKCGECVSQGYKSCLQSAADHPTWTKPANSTAQKCCLISEDCSESNKAYVCSTNYVNMVYAKYMCPFNNLLCGASDSLSFASVGQTGSLSFVLQKGDVCFYKVKTTCGRLKVDITQLDKGDATSGTVLAEFIEFEKDHMTLGEDAAKVALERAEGTPAIGMPYRKEEFTGSKHVFQGRIFTGEGPKYWGTSKQNSSEDMLAGEECNDRYTYLMFTNLDSTNSTGKVTLTVVEKEHISSSYSSYLTQLRFSLVILLILLI